MVCSSPIWDDCGDELPYIAWAVMNLDLDRIIVNPLGMHKGYSSHSVLSVNKRDSMASFQEHLCVDLAIIPII